MHHQHQHQHHPIWTLANATILVFTSLVAALVAIVLYSTPTYATSTSTPGWDRNSYELTEPMIVAWLAYYSVMFAYALACEIHARVYAAKHPVKCHCIEIWKPRDTDEAPDAYVKTRNIVVAIKTAAASCRIFEAYLVILDVILVQKAFQIIDCVRTMLRPEEIGAGLGWTIETAFIWPVMFIYSIYMYTFLLNR